MEEKQIIVYKAEKNEEGERVCMINIAIQESWCQDCDRVMLNIQPRGKYEVDLYKLHKDIDNPHDSKNYDLWLSKYQ